MADEDEEDDEVCCIEVAPPPLDEADEEFLSVLLDEVDEDEEPLPDPVEPDDTR